MSLTVGEAPLDVIIPPTQLVIVTARITVSQDTVPDNLKPAAELSPSIIVLSGSPRS